MKIYVDGSQYKLCFLSFSFSQYGEVILNIAEPVLMYQNNHKNERDDGIVIHINVKPKFQPVGPFLRRVFINFLCHKFK